MKKVWNWLYQSKTVWALFWILPFMLAQYLKSNYYPDSENPEFFSVLFSYFLMWLMPKIDDLINKHYINLKVKK